MLANLANELQEYDRESLKDFLGTMLDRVDLDPEAMSCQLHYRISVPRRNKLASPRGFAVNSGSCTLCIESSGQLRRRMPRASPC